MNILPLSIRIFPVFLTVSSTDKLVSLVAERFCVKSVYLSWFSQKTGEGLEFKQLGLENAKKYVAGNVLTHAHLWRGSKQIEY